MLDAAVIIIAVIIIDKYSINDYVYHHNMLIFKTLKSKYHHF